MNIVFHGANAETFRPGLAERLTSDHAISSVSQDLSAPGEADLLAGADIVIGTHYGAGHPDLSARLYQLPAAGYDGVDRARLPEGCAICNCFGHEAAIAEYVMATLLLRHVPVPDADARLRRGDWLYWAGGSGGLRTELGSESIGIVGHGHIGRTVAARARAFGMEVHVANRSAVEGDYAGCHGLDALGTMAGQVDILLNTLPLTEETRGLIGREVLGAMRPAAIVMNVGRGPVIDESALFEALRDRRIGGAIIDTWYDYPAGPDETAMPSAHPFHELDTVTMTPHMSGWTHGTIARRQQTMAENIDRLASGRELLNPVPR